MRYPLMSLPSAVESISIGYHSVNLASAVSGVSVLRALYKGPSIVALFRETLIVNSDVALSTPT
jgi:hypothetical protein